MNFDFSITINKTSLVSIKVLIFHATNLKNRFSKNNHIFHAAGYRSYQNFWTNKKRWIKNMSYLKDLKTGYLPMYLSQFRNLLRKLTFFEVGGLKSRFSLTGDAKVPASNLKA